MLNAALELRAILDGLPQPVYGRIIYRVSFMDMSENVDLSFDSPEQFNAVMRALGVLNYDSGYGMQHLFGTIVLRDGSWLAREEYDGSEWWRHMKKPSKKDVLTTKISDWL